MSHFMFRVSALLAFLSITGCGDPIEPTDPATGQGGVESNADGGTTDGGEVAGDSTATAPDSGTAWGTFEKVFAADSLWNSYPVKPVLGTYQIPPTQNTSYFPTVAGGAFSTAAFRAVKTDPPMTVRGPGTAANPACPDVGGNCAVVIPHWPASVKAATGSDGHADIIDVDAGIIHSFWQLKVDTAGVWHAAMYSWTPLNGSGFGDPAHYSQGARASGVCTIAGVIRIHEANDGEPMFRHALALSLDGSAEIPGFVFPATLEDRDSATAYTGKIPMGSLLMLPSTYDTSKITSPGLLKVIKTLQVYGARVVDTNTDTPFAIYVENGSTFTVSTKPPGEWDNVVASQLFDIARALRVMVGNQGFIDGNGKPFTPNQNLNRLSMRGPWNTVANGGTFDSWRQALVFPKTTAVVTQTQTNGTGARRVNWAPWTVGATFRFTVIATGGAKLNMQFKDGSYNTVLETGSLGNGESKTFVMPAANGYAVLVARSGIGEESSVRATLVAE
jgi:hypothetical protein